MTIINLNIKQPNYIYLRVMVKYPFLIVSKASVTSIIHQETLTEHPFSSHQCVISNKEMLPFLPQNPLNYSSFWNIPSATQNLASSCRCV